MDPRLHGRRQRSWVGALLRLTLGGVGVALLFGGRCQYHAHSCHGRDCDEEHASVGGREAGPDAGPGLRALHVVDFAAREGEPDVRRLSIELDAAGEAVRVTRTGDRR